MSDVLTTILVLIECISTFFCIGLTVVDGCSVVCWYCFLEGLQTHFQKNRKER